MRGWLNEGGWSFREFSVPGERGGYVGGVLGIDVGGGRHRVSSRSVDGEEDASPSQTGGGLGDVIIGDGKVRVLKREEIGVS